MPKILATDLDGTLIPLPENDINRADLKILKKLLEENQVEIVFVTGRHLASIQRASVREQLPTPNWIIADIGTSIYHRTNGDTYELVEDYHAHLAEFHFPVDDLRERLSKDPRLQPQEPEKQGRFKLSYYTDPDEMPTLVGQLEAMLRDEKIPSALIHSIDPFTYGGLIDFLPEKASKAYALDWWQHHSGSPPEEIVYAGDSGNDLAAFLAGYRTIVVRNTKNPLPRTVFDAHRQNGWHNRFYYSRGLATSGVLEGSRYFGLIPPEPNQAKVQHPPQAGIETQSLFRIKNGATPITFNQTAFRVWAPKHQVVHVQAETAHGSVRRKMTRDNNGYYHALIDGVGPGDRYLYQLNGVSRPDPVSAFQPDGVHQSSMVLDQNIFPWQDDDWRGVAKKDLVIYELHVGTFTKAGTYRAILKRLDYLRDLGITAIELMPVAQTPGRWNWGYDGVNLYAPRNSYGVPDDLKTLVDACHAAGIAVLLDVVYNHLGPEGNYLAEFGPYFSEKHHTPWGSAFNFDDPDPQVAGSVRAYIIENALYWLREFHLDGLRLDAIQFVLDDSAPHVTHELAEAVGQYKKESGRTIHLIAEANVFDQAYVALESDDSACRYDASWCDDFMHAAYSVTTPELRLTERHYLGPNDFAEALRHGYVYGNINNIYTRVTSDDRERFGTNRSKNYLSSFVVGLQTHDAIGNHPDGKRLHQLASKDAQKAIAALAFLYPTIPILFMGEEHASDSLFPFFADFTDPDLSQKVDQGRMREYPHHDWSNSPRPSQIETFQAAILTAAAHDDPSFEWYRALFKLRRESVQAGWLVPKNLEVTTDVDTGIYTLRYKENDEPRLTVIARITDHHADVPPIEIPIEGTVLLNSKPASTTDTTIRLTASHAVVFQPR